VRIGYRAEVKHIMISIVSSTRDHEIVWPPSGKKFILRKFSCSSLERFGEQRIITVTGRHPPIPPARGRPIRGAIGN
jgi:hypothetical protein